MRSGEPGGDRRPSEGAEDTDQTVGVTRRRALQAAATAGIFGVAGCSGGGGGEFGGVPPLQRAFFTVPQSPDCERDTGELRFALSYGRDVDAAAVSTDGLLTTTRGTAEFDSAVSLGWYDAYLGTDIVDEAGLPDGTEAVHEQFDRSPPSPDLDPGKTLYGRITNAVSFPDAPQFSGGKTEVPTVTYEGQVVDEWEVSYLQFHDGYVYEFATTHPGIESGSDSYPSDARYRIDPERKRVRNVNANYDVGGTGGDPDRLGVDPTTVEFAADTYPPVFQVTESRDVVPNFEHRASPVLATLHALAHKREAVLNDIAEVLSTTSVEEYKRSVWDATRDATAAIVTTIGPSPASSEQDLGRKPIRQNVPAAALASAGRVAGRAANSAQTVYSVYQTGQSLRAARRELRQWEAVVGNNPDDPVSPCRTAPINADQFVTDLEDDETCNAYDEPTPTTPYALTSLAAFQYEQALNSVATADDLDAQIDRYRKLEAEMHLQLQAIPAMLRSLRDNIGMPDIGGVPYREVTDIVSGTYSNLLSVVETELDLLDQLQSDFVAGSADGDDAAVTGQWSQVFATAANTNRPPGGGTDERPSSVWTVSPEDVSRSVCEAGYVGSFFGPVVQGNQLFACTDGGQVVAVGLDHGRIEWVQQGLDASPIGLAIDDQFVYAVLDTTIADGNPVAVALSTADGDREWTFAPSASPYVSPSLPTLAGDTLYFTGYGSNEGRLYAIEAKTGSRRWEPRQVFDGRAGINGTPAVVDGTVYLRPSGRIAAYEADTGQRRWRTEERIGVGSTEATPSVANGQLLFKESVEGEGYHSLFAYDLDRTGSGVPDQAWTTGDEIDLYDWMGAPAVADRVAYVPLDTWGIQAIDLENGRTVWDEPHQLPPDAPETFLTSVTATPEAVYYGSVGGRIHAVDPGSGSTLYRIDSDTPSSVVGVPHRYLNGYAVTNGSVYTTGESLAAWRVE
jgi:outer membrane protein assembly factor BamB